MDNPEEFGSVSAYLAMAVQAFERGDQIQLAYVVNHAKQCESVRAILEDFVEDERESATQLETGEESESGRRGFGGGADYDGRHG
ncbi:MAG: hypothetical protein ACRDSH_24015 [Pseudonocardiaceae bacterium]